MKAAYDALRGENAELRRRLGIAPDVPCGPTVKSPASAMGSDQELTRSQSDASTALVEASRNSGSEAAAVANGGAPSAGRPTMSAPPPTTQSSTPDVEPTPTQSELSGGKPRKDAVDSASGAAALIALASPKPSPASGHSRSMSPAVLGGTMPALPPRLAVAAADAAPAWPADPLQAAAAGSASVLPPLQGAPMGAEWSPMLGASGAPLGALGLELERACGPAMPRSLSGLASMPQGEQDELLNELLGSPNLLNSPHLTSSIRAYLENRSPAAHLSVRSPNPLANHHASPRLAPRGGGAAGNMSSMSCLAPLSRMGGASVTMDTSATFSRRPGQSWMGLGMMP